MTRAGGDVSALRVVHAQNPGEGEPVALLVRRDGSAEEDVERFLRLLVARDYSPNTVRAYAYDLLKLFRFLEARELSVGDFTPALAVEFLQWLRWQSSMRRAQRRTPAVVTAEGRRLAARTCNRVLAAISSFYEFLISCERYCKPDNPLLRQVDQAAARVPSLHRPALLTSADQRPIRRVLRVRTVETLPRPIPDDTYGALLAAMRKMRDIALMELMFEGGLRPGEALGIRLEDISYSRRRVTVRHRENHPGGARQKSRQDRVVDLLEDRGLPAINRYVMLERPQDADTTLVFLVGGRGKRRHEPLSYDGLVRMFARTAERVGVRDPWLTPHSLRHTHATRMADLGMRELTLMRRLGHATPDSTRVYTRLTDAQVRDDYRAALATDQAAEQGNRQ